MTCGSTASSIATVISSLWKGDSESLWANPFVGENSVGFSGIQIRTASLTGKYPLKEIISQID